MITAAPQRSSGSANDLEVFVVADGSVLPVDPALVIRGDAERSIAPAELVDLALGLLAEATDAVDFIWTGDEAAPYWDVHLEKVRLGRRTAVRLCASRTHDLKYSLTKRELDVVTLLIAGLSNAAIASALTLSPRTVTTHVDHIMRKMEAPSRSAVATLALDAGIIGVPLPVCASEFQTLRVGRVVRLAGTRRRVESTARGVTGPTTPILIGSLVPLVGRAREDGVEMVQGAALAIEEINARGGIHGRTLQFQVENVDIDRDGFADVTEAMHRLLDSGVHAITSGYLLHQERAVQLAAEEGVPLLHASAASCIDDLVAGEPERYRGIFQVCPGDRNYATNYVAFMTQLRDTGQWIPPSRDLVIAQQTMWEIIDFGLGSASRLAHDSGWDLIPVEVPDREDSAAAWGSLPSRIGDPAAVMLGTFFVDDHLRFLHCFLTKPSQSLIYSIYAPSVPAFRRRAPLHADGLLWATTTGTYSDEIARQFAHDYKAKFGVLPGRSMAGAAYDRIHILGQMWGQIDDPCDYDEVSTGLLRTRYRGVNGSYSFNSPGHGTLPLGTVSNDPSIAQAHTVFQIQGGRNVLLGPQPYAKGRFMPPPWTRRDI